jgi:hypothetical protein
MALAAGRLIQTLFAHMIVMIIVKLIPVPNSMDLESPKKEDMAFQ